MKTKLNLLISFLFFISALSYSQYTPQSGGGICSEAAPICTSNGEYTWPCGTSGDAEAGPDYGCMGTESNPAWYYFRIENSGDIILQLNAPQDIDFVIWGPFIEGPNCNYSELQEANVIDCSVSITNQETPEIGPGSSTDSGYSFNPTTATEGEFYMIMITNLSGEEQSFTFEQTGGTGSLDCEILCPLQSNNFSITIGDCEPHQNENTYYSEFDLSGSISFVENTEFDSIAFFRNGDWFYSEIAPLTSPSSFILDNLSANGEGNTIISTLYVDGEVLCSTELQFTAPVNCAYCSANAGEDIVSNQNTLSLDAQLEVSDYNMYWNTLCEDILIEDSTLLNTQITKLNNNSDTCLFIWTVTNYMNLTCSDTMQVIFILAPELPIIMPTVYVTNPNYVFSNPNSDSLIIYLNTDSIEQSFSDFNFVFQDYQDSLTIYQYSNNTNKSTHEYSFLTIHKIIYENNTLQNEINSKDNKFSIQPNPAKNDVVISFEKQNTGTIQLYNLSGQLVFEEVYVNQKELNISVQDLKKGIYLVKNKEENRIEITKLIVE